MVRDHVRNVGLTVVRDLQSKGGMDVSDDEGAATVNNSSGSRSGSSNELVPKAGVTSDDVVAAMLKVMVMNLTAAPWIIGYRL